MQVCPKGQLSLLRCLTFILTTYKLTSSCKYTEDCTQYDIVQNDGKSNIQEALNVVNDWADINRMQLNSKKIKDMWICFRNVIEPPPSLTLDEDIIERVTSFKLRGV